MADINWSEWSRIKYYNDDEIIDIKKRYERLFKHYKINTRKSLYFFNKFQKTPQLYLKSIL